MRLFSTLDDKIIAGYTGVLYNPHFLGYTNVTLYTFRASIQSFKHFTCDDIPGSKIQGGQEGGIRVPTAVVWAGHIPANITIDVPSSQLDLMPTLLDAVGIEMPRDRIIDGKNILPVLERKETKSPHEIMFHWCNAFLHAARYIPKSGL